MTPEEIKAEELIESFGKPVKCKVTDKLTLPISMHMEQRINSVIILVEEIIKIDASRADFNGVYIEWASITPFWNKVLKVLKNKLK